MQQEQPLTQQQESIAVIAAFAAAGNLSQLNAALQQGLDARLTISDCREVLVQMYAYAGFPRSLNALGELMKALDERKQRGIQHAPGRAPSHPIPQGEALLVAGAVSIVSDCRGCGTMA